MATSQVSVGKYYDLEGARLNLSNRGSPLCVLFSRNAGAIFSVCASKQCCSGQRAKLPRSDWLCSQQDYALHSSSCLHNEDVSACKERERGLSFVLHV